MKPITKSAKLANVLYDIRGPIMDAARQMEDEGQKKSSNSTWAIWPCLGLTRLKKFSRT